MKNNAGAIELDSWGLVVVDMQNDFLAQGGYYARRLALDAQIKQGAMSEATRNQLLSHPSSRPTAGLVYRDESLPAVVSNVIMVIEQARSQQRPIAYLKAVYSRTFEIQPSFLRQDPNRNHYPCKPDTWGAAFIEPISEPIKQCAQTSGPASRECVIVKHTFNGFFQTELLQFLRGWDVKTVVIVGVETHVCVLTTAQSASLNQFKTVILEDCVWTAKAALGQAALAIFRDAFGSTTCSDFWLSGTGK